MLPLKSCRDARDHGVEVRPVCVNASRWDCTLEPTDREDRFAVRLGFRMVHGLANGAAAAIVAARADTALRLDRRSLAARRCPCRRPGSDSPRRMPSGPRSDSPVATLYGRSRRCATSRCRCSPSASAREGATVPEIREPVVALRPMTDRRRSRRGLWPCRAVAPQSSRVLPARRASAQAQHHLR